MGDSHQPNPVIYITHVVSPAEKGNTDSFSAKPPGGLTSTHWLDKVEKNQLVGALSYMPVTRWCEQLTLSTLLKHRDVLGGVSGHFTRRVRKGMEEQQAPHSHKRALSMCLAPPILRNSFKAAGWKTQEILERTGWRYLLHQCPFLTIAQSYLYFTLESSLQDICKSN